VIVDSGRLDDPQALAAADPGDMLRQVASSAAQVRQARYLAGEADLVVGGRTVDVLVESMSQVVADLRGVALLPGCGHWTQQEQPDEVNAALLEFAASLP